MIIPLGEWLPDLPPLNNPGALTANNVIPGPNSTYEPFPDFNRIATGSAGVMLGAISARDNNNNVYVYAGDTSALWRQSGLSLTAATRTVGGAYNTAIDDAWEFVTWGQTVIGVNGHADVPQQISLGASTFVDLTGMPKARHIAVIKDFVVVGNVSDSSTQVQRVRWSAINNSGSWTPDPATLADYQDIPGDGGWIQKIISGEQGYIFQERAITRMSFVGSPLIFQFDKIHDGIGAYCPQAVVSYENMVYFVATDGFKRFDGTNIKNIGEGKVDQTFLADLDTNYLSRVRGIIAPDKKIVMWAYPGAGNIGGLCNFIMIYSWAYDRWSLIEGNTPMQIDLIFNAATLGYTLDGLDAVSSSVDALMFSLDSKAWTGGTLQFGFFSNGQLYYFNDTPMDAFVQTNEVNLATAQAGKPLRNKSEVKEVWPILDGTSANVSVSIQYRNVTTEDEADTGDLPITSAGFAQSRVCARYHRFGITTSGGDYDQLQGVDVQFTDAGER